MRHGKTKGNEARRYIGSSDESLSCLGQDQVKRLGTYPAIKVVFVSTLRRSQETARLLFPVARQIIVDGIEELDFGEFEGKTSDELADHAAYQTWVDAECSTRCPQGEGISDIVQRSDQAFRKIIAHAKDLQIEPVIIVAHAGSIMAIMQQFADDERNYFEWSLAHTEGWKLVIEPDEWEAEIENESVKKAVKFKQFERFERLVL